MGLSIGGITGSLAALRSSPDFGQARLGARRDPISLPGARRTDDNGRGPFFNRQEPRQVEVGLGRGLSPQGAALRTINATIENTRRTIPTFEEIRERFILTSSARREEVQRAAAERTERSLTRRVESRIPEASAQVQNFVSSPDEAPGQAEARLEAPALVQAQARPEAVQAEAPTLVQAPAQTAPEAEATGDTQPAAPTFQTEGRQFDFSTSENRVRLDVSV